MAKGITTSIRIDPDLRDQLEYASQIMHRGKNWIIIHALQKYLANIETIDLVKEAQRESLLATQKDMESEDDWQDMQDTTGWK